MELLICKQVRVWGSSERLDPWGSSSGGQQHDLKSWRLLRFANGQEDQVCHSFSLILFSCNSRILCLRTKMESSIFLFAYLKSMILGLMKRIQITKSGVFKEKSPKVKLIKFCLCLKGRNSNSCAWLGTCTTSKLSTTLAGRSIWRLWGRGQPAEELRAIEDDDRLQLPALTSPRTWRRTRLPPLAKLRIYLRSLSR